MNRIVAFAVSWAAFLGGLLAVSQAQILTLGVGPGSFGGGGCAQNSTFIARTSGTSAAEQAAYKAMICGIVADGNFAGLDVLYIFATNTQTTALLNLVSTSFSGTTHGTVSFSADHGYTGDASTFYIDSGFVPTASNFTQNSASAGCYVLNSRVAQQAWVELGETAANIDLQINPLSGTGGGGLSYGITTTAFQISIANANAQGSYLVSRTASNSDFMFKNGASINTAADASAAPSATQKFFVLAENTGSQTAGAFSGDTIAAAWWGAGMTTTQAGLMQSRINGYMTALGINVY